MDVIISVVKGEDVFGVLPTEYGKSLCYACLPWVFDNLYPIEKPSIVIVVSSLTAIMIDQKLFHLQCIYLSAVYIFIQHLRNCCSLIAFH